MTDLILVEDGQGVRTLTLNRPEKLLSRAVRYHAEDRVLLIGSKTVVFS